LIGVVNDDIGGFYLAACESIGGKTTEFYIDEFSGHLDRMALEDFLNEHNQNRGAVFRV
jgi:hypothetical protein